MSGDYFFKTCKASEIKGSAVIDLLRQDNNFAVGEILGNLEHINYIFSK